MALLRKLRCLLVPAATLVAVALAGAANWPEH